VKASAPLKPPAGVYVTDPFAFNVANPFVGCEMAITRSCANGVSASLSFAFRLVAPVAAKV